MIADNYMELSKQYQRIFEPPPDRDRTTEPELYDEAGLIVFTEQDLLNLNAA